MRSLFVTGGSGFIGRRFLSQIPAGRYRRIVALSRRPQLAMDGVTWVQGDLASAAPWKQFLDDTTDVAHFAAATGAVSAAVHRAVNADGTETLVRACERARAAGLLFVSSIAARYPEDAHYPYATSKREAEAIVRGSVVPFVIVRPTIVLGDGAPILGRLRSLAGGPVITVIGDGLARVQPIDVDDVAAAVTLLLERRAFDGGTRELGGPEVLTMEKLLGRIRHSLGKARARVVHLPYGPARGGLIVAEALLGGRSPVSAGQLTAFVQNSEAQPDAFWEALRPRLKTIEQMVKPAGTGVATRG
ncbi:MAG TPA: NAD-dependent epimerase/dehydratase family protein [Gemmatimonadales bacterium]|jgi:NADH dehydrogenase